MPKRASVVNDVVCQCGKTLAKGGYIKCPRCGVEVPTMTPVDLIVGLVDQLGVNKEVLKSQLVPYEGQEWIRDMVGEENIAHSNFFGRVFDLTLYRDTLAKLGPKKVAEWEKLGLRVHFLPDVIFTQESTFPGWKVKPEKWYWDSLAESKLFCCNADGKLITVNKANLGGIIVLVDTRKKPSYKEGEQMFTNDKLFLGQLIADLRKEGKIARYEYGPQTSRFGVSADEWQDYIQPALVEKITEVSWRLETVIEMNVIPQLYRYMPRKDDGQTNTWVWLEEFFEDGQYRLYGGYSDFGGLSYVNWYYADFHWSDRSFRPLGVLAP